MSTVLQKSKVNHLDTYYTLKYNSLQYQLDY